MPNKTLTWDGVKWRATALLARTGKTWKPADPPRIWDGSQWRTARLPAVEFPRYIDATKGSFTDVDVVTLPLPDGIRLSDTVVSVCASYGESVPTPRRMLASDSPQDRGVETEFDPLRGAYAAVLDPTKLRLKVSVIEWHPNQGRSVSWRVSGKKNTGAVVANFIYRQARTDALPAEPIIDYKTAVNTDRLDLQAGTDFTSLYVAVALSRDLTGSAWPDGFTNTRDAYGRFSDLQVHMMAADTVGAPASPGTLQLDATVDQLAVALITIPGRANPDGHGVWILGDQEASVLGKTTYLE
ncbi:hypothetical protein ACIBCO_22130 [Streptomyces violascens]|uniref:hypothetical protein n=1 Tax=Streptomyces violascens TaxID=67381 RepID=UPI00379CE196